MHAPAEERRSHLADSRLAQGLALALASLAAGIWLWSHTCQFPAMVWNDIRLAPAVALAQGWQIYPTPGQGTINTWTYGPLPLLFLWPATWAASAPAALQVASLLNLSLILVPLALVCFGWPADDVPAASRLGRLTAFLLCALAWPAEFYALYYADSLALACGLLGNLLLLRFRPPASPSLWLAAVLAAGAVAAKQTALGIPLAQVLWLGLNAGWRAAARHALRCVVAGLLFGAASVAIFGWGGLWFVLVELPAGFRWFPEPLKRLWFVAPELALYLGLPAALMLWQRQAFLTRPALQLAALSWACTIPLGLLALLKLGGRTNSLYSFPVWLPIVAVAALAALRRDRRWRWLPLAAVCAAAALGCLRLLAAPRLPLRPQTAAYRDADSLARQLPGRVWFPFHPLVTLYTDRRYYHDEDGLFVWQTTLGPIPPAQAAAHLPPAMQFIALRQGWSDWGVARRMLPPNARSTAVGDWTLWHAAATPAPARNP